MRLELLAISLSFAAILSSCENEDRLSSDLINISATASSVKSDAEVLFPSIEFEVTEYDFGTITAGRKVFREFQFTNTGNAPLLIANVHPQCGCTATKDWPKEPIKPGEGGTIKVEFDSTDRTGKQKKIIDVITNATPPTARLLLNGVVIGPDFTSEDI